MHVLEWMSDVFAAVGDVWAFRAPASLVSEAHASLPVAVGVAVLAGLSTMVGHAVVFAINRVSGLRLLAGMALGAAYTVLLRSLIAATLAVAAVAVTQGRVDGETVGICYLFALAPLALAFLVFIPHFGLYIGRVLEGWTLLCLVALISPVLGVGRWYALAVAGGAWLIGQLLSRLLSRPLAAVSSRVWSLATGHDTFLTAQDILSGAPFVPLERRERPA
jgi:hypothetical protein